MSLFSAIGLMFAEMDRERHKMRMQESLIDVNFCLSENCAILIISDVFYLASDTNLTNHGAAPGGLQVLPE